MNRPEIIALTGRGTHPALAVLAVLAMSLWAPPTVAEDAVAPPVTAPVRELPPAADNPEPLGACHRAARQQATDAYPCDLAVQVGRDAGDPRVLAGALSNRALVLARGGRLEPALEDLDAALQAAPEMAALHGNRGNLLLRLNRPDAALAAHHRAVELAPRSATEYYNRAFSYRAVGEPRRAADDVATARALLEPEVVPPQRFMPPRTPGPAAPPDR